MTFENSSTGASGPLYAEHNEALQRDSGFAAPVGSRNEELLHRLSPLQIGKKTEYMSDGSEQKTYHIGLNLLGLVNLKFKVGHETTIGPEVRAKLPGVFDVGASVPIVTDEKGIRLSPRAHGYAIADQFGGQAGVECGLGAATGCGVEASAKAGPIGMAEVRGSAAIVQDGAENVKLSVSGRGGAEVLGTVGANGAAGLKLDKTDSEIYGGGSVSVGEAHLGVVAGIFSDRNSTIRPDIDLTVDDGTDGFDIFVNPPAGADHITDRQPMQPGMGPHAREVNPSQSYIMEPSLPAPLTVSQDQIFQPETPIAKEPWWKQMPERSERREDFQAP